ncbi:hypothetical protein GEMRC1_011488 [Eukaryota sp. GEM-RC1]
MVNKVQTTSCRFLKWAPAAANVVAFSPDGNQLAVLRESRQIEIWLPKHGWSFSHSLPCPIGTKVISMTFVRRTTGHPLLVVGTLAGTLHTYDPNTNLRPSTPSSSFGGAVFCIAPHPRHPSSFLAGCEDGCIRIFDIPEDNILLSTSLEPYYRRAFPRISSYVVSMAVLPQSDTILFGDAHGGLRSMHLPSSHPNLLCASSNTPHPIRATLILPDGTFIAGDHHGVVSIYSMEGCIASFDTIFDGPVVGLARSEDRIVVAGLDGKIGFIEKTNDTWILLSVDKVHLHDGLSLATSS